MEISAHHVQHKEFHDQWRGYSQEEVDDFLDRVAEALDELERENRDLRGRLRQLDNAVENSKNTEEMLKKTLVTAQQAAEEAIAAAKTKAEQLIGEAEIRAQHAGEEIKSRVANAEDEVRRKTMEAEREQLAKSKELEQSIERLKSFESDLKNRLRTFFEQQLKVIESLGDAPARREETPSSQAPPAQTQTPRQENVEQARPVAHVSQPHQAVVIPDGEEEVGSNEGFEDFAPVEDGVRRRVRRGLFRRDGREEEEWSQQV
jgi:cell division initiation protein